MRFLLLGFLCVLAACGFQPVHGTRTASGTVSQAFQSMSISNIPDREGQILRNNLVDRLHLRGTPKKANYALTVSPLSTRVVRLGIAADASTTRAQYEVHTDVILKDARSDEVLLEQQFRGIAAFNILGSEFQTVVTEEDARNRVLNDIAAQIETRLSLYFNR